MPPRRGTPWASHGSLLSDRIRPPSSPQPTRSEKGKGKAKAVTPEPPTRSATVRRFDELLDGLCSSSTSNQQPKREIRTTATAQGTGVSADHEGCFCQGTYPEPHSSLNTLRFSFDAIYYYSIPFPFHHSTKISSVLFHL
jgi:hypothetical protein